AAPVPTEPADPVMAELQDRYEALRSPRVRVEEACTWAAGVGSILTFGSMVLGLKAVVATLGPVGTPLAATVCIFGFAAGTIRMQKRDHEKRALEAAMQRRQGYLHMLEDGRQEVLRMAAPGSGSVAETDERVTLGGSSLKKKRA
ncbi:MAG: hypothetical protein AB1758_25355, partial [Candidatus Eremiobacterota bacterium]